MTELKRLNKIVAVFLAAMLAVMPLGIISGAVSYPEGVSKETAEEAVPKLNTLAKALMKTALPGGELKDTVNKTICSDSTLNSLFAGIYGAIGENAGSLNMVGIDLTPSKLASFFSAYPDVKSKISSCTNINAVIELSKNFKWGVSTRDGFAAAFAAIMSPFNELLNAVLCSGTVKINNFLSIKGADGYSSAVVPLLKALGSPSIMSSKDFAAGAAAKRSSMIKNILNMLFAALDRLLADPVIGATETLPVFAWYIDSGKLSASLKAMLEPLSLKIGGFLTIPGISDLISKAGDMENGLDINAVFDKLSEEAGGKADFDLPEIDIKALAQCGTASGDSFTPDKGAALMTVLRWALEAVRLNADKLKPAGGEKSPLDVLLSKTDDEIIKIIITLLTFKEEVPPNPYKWVYPAMTPAAVQYTENLTSAEFTEILEKIDPLITEFIKEENPEGSVDKLLREKLFSNAALGKLLKGFYSFLSNPDFAGLFGILEIPVYPSVYADSIASYFPSAAKRIRQYSSWEKVNPEALYFGFENGDREGFEKALVRIFSPFDPLFRCVLAGEDYTVLGSVTIPGSDGYNTVIIPLLEAIGCDSEDIKTYGEYKDSVSSSAVRPVISPIVSLLDRICEKPVATLCGILPNIIYFTQNDIIKSCVENLLYPVKFMLDKAGLGSLLNDAMASMPAFDLNEKAAELIKSTDISFVLPSPDLKKLGTLGTAEIRSSKRTENGVPAEFTYVKADSPAVMLTLLRYLVGALTLEENSGVLKGFMAGMQEETDKKPGEENMPDMFAMFAENLGSKFKGMSIDQIIEWLYDLLFRETPMVSVPDPEAEPPTIIYEKEWHMPPALVFLIILILAGLAFLIYKILVKKGKVAPVLETIRKKRDKKEQQLQYEKLIRARLLSGEITEEEAKRALPEKKEKKDKKAEKQPEEYKGNLTPLQKRQEKAAEKSKKNEEKSQKHYEKAIREADKKKQKQGGTDNKC